MKLVLCTTDSIHVHVTENTLLLHYKDQPVNKVIVLYYTISVWLCLVG